MRFKYSTTDPAQDEFDSLPRMPLVLRYDNRQIEEEEIRIVEEDVG